MIGVFGLVYSKLCCALLMVMKKRMCSDLDESMHVLYLY